MSEKEKTLQPKWTAPLLMTRSRRMQPTAAGENDHDPIFACGCRLNVRLNDERCPAEMRKWRTAVLFCSWHSFEPFLNIDTIRQCAGLSERIAFDFPGEFLLLIEQLQYRTESVFYDLGIFVTCDGHTAAHGGNNLLVIV